MRPVRSVFISNNGLADHIGMAQVLPYLSGLARRGHAHVTALTVEERGAWDDPDKVDTIRNSGLDLHPVWRREGPLAQMDRLMMSGRLSRALTSVLAPPAAVDLLHCRSYMPLRATLGAARRFGLPFVFDMRGFWIDQRIESAAWSSDNLKGRALIHHFRRLESAALGRAAAIVVLTEDARAVVEAHPGYRGAALSVIPCSVDQTSFAFDPERRAALRAQFAIADDETLVAWLGSASGLYRMDLVYRYFNAVRAGAPRARLLFIGRHDRDAHLARAHALGIALSAEEIICTRVPHMEVPGLLSAADIGLSLIVSTPSSLGVSATKVGEYLACGLPVISNAGIGDIERIIRNGENGAVLQAETEDDIERCAALATGPRPDRAAVKAMTTDYFSLDRAIDSYKALYRAAVA